MAIDSLGEDGVAGVIRRFLNRSNGAPSTAAERADRASGDAAQADMLARVRGFADIRVEDVMVPRADVIAIEVTTSLLDAAKQFLEAGHSRLPLYRDTLDDPLGMVHIKDLMAPLVRRLAGEDVGSALGAGFLERLKREVLYVPPSAAASELLLRMQSTRIHMALVVDEFGGTDGLVTIEDLIEEIVGDIEDEHDEDVPQLLGPVKGAYMADARLELDEFERLTGARLARDGQEDVDTLGGLVFSLVARVPTRGEIIRDGSGWEFEVAEADARRIKRLRIRRSKSVKAAT